ncbi:hypothetical protein SAMN05421786_101339 [Chryseobacterium ureilyticum]|uniref:Lipoprotein n=2 Tax=Chryseobacterium ureilyticum TaxID=373668 RepID=A0A1N7KAH1_9FLAO|nr:hypothetical protein SAMN05421786_101339 [Chryseobacterium ureilyticum]
MKCLNHISIMSFSILISTFSCTKTDNKPVVKKIHQDQKIKADTVITTSAVLLLSPDEKEIEEIKKKQGEDNFYTLADDANYYSAEIDEAAPQTIYLSHRTIDFPKENYVFSKDKFEDKWIVIDYKEGYQPKAYSLVDYHSLITEKQSSDR